MKYKDFYKYLTVKVADSAFIGPSISIKINKVNFNHEFQKSISMSKIVNEKLFSNFRFVIFPIKIYGENIRHLNILILDQKTKIIERYEPFNHYLNFHQINDTLEPLLYKLMNQKKIYFLKYNTTLNTETILNDKNCGLYCIKYVVEKIRGRKE